MDLSGHRFGRLVAIRQVEYPGKNTAWLCKCDCGNYTTVITPNLRAGKTRSCGCGVVEATIARSTTHGESNKSRLYRIWKGMKDRCYRKTNNRYNRYGGRGITVCPEWEHSYETFRNWALSHGYADDLSIDRIDNDKGYSPENCRWATIKQQHLNTRRNHLITYQGKTQTVVEWAEELGIPAGILHQRIYRGWSDEDILTVPIGGKRPGSKT